MGGKKRTRDNDEGYGDIMRKIRKLEKEVKKKKRRRLSSSSDGGESQRGSMCSDPEFYDEIPMEEFHEDLSGFHDASPTPAPVMSALPAPAAQGPPATAASGPQAQDHEAQASGDTPPDQDLDQEILDILGDDPSTENLYGEDLHKDIAPRWKNILLNGLSKENRNALQKLYLPSKNCPFMKAPKLNAEIEAALTEINNKKDIYSQSKQNQLTSCLAAIGKIMNIALTRNMGQEVIKPLSDAGRLLCDYHYKESLSRRYAAMNTLTKQTKDTIKSTKIDEFLFGADLAEQLKSSKAISKSGLEMRPVAGPSGIRKLSSTVSQPPAVRRAPALNARGTPRAPAAEPRANPAPRRPPPAPRQPAAGPGSRPPPPPRYRSRRP